MAAGGGGSRRRREAGHAGIGGCDGLGLGLGDFQRRLRLGLRLGLRVEGGHVEIHVGQQGGWLGSRGRLRPDRFRLGFGGQYALNRGIEGRQAIVLLGSGGGKADIFGIDQIGDGGQRTILLDRRVSQDGVKAEACNVIVGAIFNDLGGAEGERLDIIKHIGQIAIGGVGGCRLHWIGCCQTGRPARNP